MTNEIKELEKKHLCSYLPYELKVSNQFGIHKVLGLRSKSSSNNNLMISYKLHGDVVWGYSSQNKPLLRPMSDLYKEINGEVGIDVIGKMFEPNGVLNFEDGNYYYGWNTHVCDDYQGYEIGWIDEAGWFGIFFDTYDYDNQTENFTGDYLPYNRNVAEYLDRKHFDWRYDLIIKGLAIDKKHNKGMEELLIKIQAGYVLQDEDVALIARYHKRITEMLKDIDAYSDLGIEHYKTRPRVLRSLFISIKNRLTD